MLLGSLQRYSSNEIPSKSLLFEEVSTRTQGQIEGNYFKILKTIDFQGKKHLRIDEFLKEQYTHLDARLVDVGESLLRPQKKAKARGKANRR